MAKKENAYIRFADCTRLRGSDPFSALSARLREVSSANWKSTGTAPLNELPAKFAADKYASLDRPDGSVPVREFELRSRALYQTQPSQCCVSRSNCLPPMHCPPQNAPTRSSLLASKQTASREIEATFLQHAHREHVSVAAAGCSRRVTA